MYSLYTHTAFSDVVLCHTIEYAVTLGKKASGFTRICTRVQSSEMTKFLDIFEDQKIDKMDIISCHDPQVVK